MSMTSKSIPPIPIVIDNPSHISLIDQLSANGEMTKTQLEKSIGRKRATNTLNYFDKLSMRLKEGCKEYLEELNDTIESNFQKINNDLDLIVIKMKKIEGKLQMTISLNSNAKVKPVSNARVLLYKYRK